jgi:hypothetical protein
MVQFLRNDKSTCINPEKLFREKDFTEILLTERVKDEVVFRKIKI